MNPQSPYPPQPGQGPSMPPQQQMPGSAMPPGQPMPPYPQPAGMSANSSKRKTPWILIILLVIFVIGTLVASGFAVSASNTAADYKNNVQQKVDAAVEVAVKDAEATKEREFLERNKSPYKVYKGPGTYGAVEITYPKTWSATVDEKSASSSPIFGYFHPDYVPGPKSGTAFALKIEVMERPYNTVLGSYESYIKKGSVKASPYKAKRVPSATGSRLVGEVERGYQGITVLLPLRDKTIRITTLSRDSFGADFDKIIMEKLIFTP